MSKPPAFQFYANDFLIDTIEWTLEERGAHITLLSYEWDKGSIPASSQALARLIGVDKKDFERIWLVVGEKYQPMKGKKDRLVNRRLEEEREKQRKRREKLQLAGRKGGKKSRKPSLSNAKATLKPPLSQAQARPKPSEEEDEDIREEGGVGGEEKTNSVLKLCKKHLDFAPTILQAETWADELEVQECDFEEFFTAIARVNPNKPQAFLLSVIKGAKQFVRENSRRSRASPDDCPLVTEEEVKEDLRARNRKLSPETLESVRRMAASVGNSS